MSTPLLQRAARLQRAPLFGALAVAAGLAACATEPPPGPSFAVLPKAGESFADFQQHDFACRNYAAGSVGGASAEGKAVAGAAAGAGVGAAAGALIGSADGRAGKGAAIGAGSGLLLGSLVGLGRERRAEAGVQRRYDIAYAQCMTTYGEQAPLPAPRPVVYAPPPVVYVPAPVVYPAPPAVYAPAPPPAP